MKQCGQCRLCCKLFALPFLNKPGHQWCQYSCPKGCAIYANRPQLCKDYTCVWLAQEEIPEKYRPDKSRLVLTNKGSYQDRGVILAAEADEGAADTKLGKELLKGLLSVGNIVVVSYNGRVRGVYGTNLADGEGALVVREMEARYKDGAVAQPSGRT